MIDELVEYTEFDPELKDDIKRMDEKARKKGVTFYELASEILNNYNLNKKAKDRMNSKSANNHS